MAQRDNKLVYPPGVRDITGDISTDDLVRRLKDCAQAFQNMSQDDDNNSYIPLALHLASETFLEHPSQDVRLLVACCIADVFRVYAPDAPYKDMVQVKVIFEFFVDQLRGLEDPSKPSFKRYFYLLENFSCVKTFNICVELEDNQKILCRLFKLMFKIINENHSAKVKKFILDMLSPLISESDAISRELLEIILSQIIEPVKTQNHNACHLAQDILKKNISSLESSVQTFFNSALILGQTVQNDVSRHLYELIYELNDICPSMLIAVLPQLEFKLKSNEEKERLDVTRVLARMFSDKNSTMIEENTTLWSCFLARFNDISPQVRIRCVQYCKNFLINHPESKDDITEQLKQRSRDVDENVRYEVVLAIVSTGREDLSCISEELLMFVKERTLDKKFKIRKEALLGLGNVYKEHIRRSDMSPSDLEKISWIKNKVLHAYYQTCLEDRLLVERILHTSLVPYHRPMEERMKLLYQLFCSVDDYAVKAFKEIMKCQSLLRTQVRSIIEVIQREKNDDREKTLATKVSFLSKSLQDSAKSSEYISKFCDDLESNLRLRNMMLEILNGNISCTEAEAKVRDILKSLGNPTPANAYYLIIKQLLERIAPVMIDKEGIQYLVDFVKNSLLGDSTIDAELCLQDTSHRGLELLWVLTFVFPTAFHDELIYNNLLLFLQVEDEISADMALQIFMNISNDMEINFPEFSAKLLPILENFVETGTSKQAKHAVYCIHSIVSDKERVFGDIIKNLKNHCTVESQYFTTALVSIGHIAFLCHDMFADDLKHIIGKYVVRDLLMHDQDLPRGGDALWGPFDSLPEETKAKIEGMKVMVRWLAGLKNMTQPAMSTLRLLSTVIQHGGDLMERQHTAPVENSWLRLSAATCMLKLCQEPKYVNALPPEQFHTLAFILNDVCQEVRDRFAQKVHKGLFTLKLPLEFLAVLSLAALDERKDFKSQVKNYLIVNINKRKEYIKHRVLGADRLRAFLPDYSLPYAVHLLAYSPFLTAYNDVPALLKIKECLWFLMEPLMLKNENYSFSFFKRLLENIKQTKPKKGSGNSEENSRNMVSKQPPEDSMNMKLYAVCDLALSIVMSKKGNFLLKEYPVEPALPSKFFTDPDPNFSNFKTYLPPELIDDAPLRSGFEIERFEDSKNESSVSQVNSSSATVNASMDFSQNDDSISDVTSKENESVAENASESIIVKTRSRTRKKANEKKINNSEVLSEESSEKSDCVNDQEKHEKHSRHLRNSNGTDKKLQADIDVKDKLINMKKLKVQLTQLNLTQLPSIASSSKSSESEFSEKQNGTLSSNTDISSVCTSDVHGSLKKCNVSLSKDDVERYIALNNFASNSHVENSVSDEDFLSSPATRNKSKKVTDSTVLKKRKSEDSPDSRSVKSKMSSRSSDSYSSQSFPKGNNNIKRGNKMPLVNGNRGSKGSHKGSTVQKSQNGSQSSLKRNQKNQVNLRKR